MAEVAIRDKGVGMPPELVGRVFEMFVQAEQSLARSRGGLGIGLTLVRSLAEMHGGMVIATSAGLGKGSEFSVRLPLARPAPPNPPVPGRCNRCSPHPAAKRSGACCWWRTTPTPARR